jgi:sugar O-acyltransferase (sialic acid O-acetyltransferase NeuD family)
MLKDDLVLIGAGGHARSCIDVIEQEGKFRIAGLVGVTEEVDSRVLNYDVIGIDAELDVLAAQFKYALITLGQIASPEDRIRLFDLSVKAGFVLPTIVASSAYVSPHAIIGAGTIVMHGAIINSDAVIGRNCIINSRSLIEHGSHVADHCHVSTGAILNGNTSIGIGSFIGSGATIKEGVSVGSRSRVGMGLSLRHDLSENSSFLGMKNS